MTAIVEDSHIYVKTPDRVSFMWLQAWLKEHGYNWPTHKDRPAKKYKRHGKVDYGDHIHGIHIYRDKNLMYLLGDDTFPLSYDIEMNEVDQFESITEELKFMGCV